MIERNLEALLTFFQFDPTYWATIRTTIPIERLNKAIKRRPKAMEVTGGDTSTYRLITYAAMTMEYQWSFHSATNGRTTRNPFPEFTHTTPLDPPCQKPFPLLLETVSWMGRWPATQDRGVVDLGPFLFARGDEQGRVAVDDQPRRRCGWVVLQVSKRSSLCAPLLECLWGPGGAGRSDRPVSRRIQDVLSHREALTKSCTVCG